MKTLFPFVLTAFLNLIIFSSFPLNHLKTASPATTIFACPSGDITLTTQAEVDNFATTYPACMILLGSLTIGPSTNITNLNGLSGIIQVTNSLIISNNTMLTDISGISGLTSVGVTISIGNNPNLINIDISNISGNITGEFKIQNNAELTNLAAPLNLSSITNDLVIRENPKLATITGLENVTDIGFSLVILQTLEDDLPDFSKLTSVGRSILFQQNTNATTINIPNINGNITGEFKIQNNAELTNLAAPLNLSSIGNDLVIRENPKLATITGLENVTDIGFSLVILQTLEDDLPDFSKLTSVGRSILFQQNTNATTINIPNINGNITGEFKIQNNAELTNLAAPLNLSSIGNDLVIRENPKLATITGLENVTDIGFSLVILQTLEDDLPDFSKLTSVGRSILFNKTLMLPPSIFQILMAILLVNLKFKTMLN